METWFVILAVLVFSVVGIVLIVRRTQVARGESLVFGGKMPVGCVVFQGILFLIGAALFVVGARAGWFG